MAAVPVITPAEIKVFISDFSENNNLLDGVEFGDTQIALAIELAVDDFNRMTPFTQYNLLTFPSKSLALYGALYHLFNGQMALLARNTMSYSDGGIQIPVEERMALYQQLAASYGEMFQSNAAKLKITLNMESGWGEVRSDQSWFPVY